MKLTQSDYIKRIFAQHRMDNAKPIKIQVQGDNHSKIELKTKDYSYTEIIGNLLYISISQVKQD
jgi:hypothetical protein